MFSSTRIQEERRPRPRCRRLAGMLAATPAAVLASAAPALALPGLERRDGSSAIDSLAEQTATAYCPEGKRVFGGGGNIVRPAGGGVSQRGIGTGLRIESVNTLCCAPRSSRFGRS